MVQRRFEEDGPAPRFVWVRLGVPQRSCTRSATVRRPCPRAAHSLPRSVVEVYASTWGPSEMLDAHFSTTSYELADSLSFGFVRAVSDNIPALKEYLGASSSTFLFYMVRAAACAAGVATSILRARGSFASLGACARPFFRCVTRLLCRTGKRLQRWSGPECPRSRRRSTSWRPSCDTSVCGAVAIFGSRPSLCGWPRVAVPMPRQNVPCGAFLRLPPARCTLVRYYGPCWR
jgi:hypothetical protein